MGNWYNYKNYTNETLKGNLSDIFILKIHMEYISFIFCTPNLNNCSYKSSNHEELLNGNFKLYSACNGVNISGQNACLTVVEFSKTIAENGRINGTTINVRNTTMIRNPETPLICHNEGKKDSNSEKCICKVSDAFVNHGPQCQATQQKLQDPQYLYVLPNSLSLTIEFSLSAPAHNTETNILKIKSLFNYSINNIYHIVGTQYNSTNISYPLDKDNVWLDIFINISSSLLKFRINEKEQSFFGDFTKSLMLDTKPLIIYEGNIYKRNNLKDICLSNLRINSEIVDLYTPSYKDCIENSCRNCLPEQNCYYSPFKSTANTKCVCKTGISNSANCTTETIISKEIKNKKSHEKDKLQLNNPNVNFRFQTLSNYGTLVKFFMSQTPNFTVSIEINDGYLSVTVVGLSKTLKKTIDCCMISNGIKHQVQLSITNYRVEMIIDENLNKVGSVLLDNKIVGQMTALIVSKIIFGPLENTQLSDSSLSTCFDTFFVMNKSYDLIPIPGLFDNLAECYNGKNCSSIPCSSYEICEYKWQNSKCVCKQNFTNINGSCSFAKCYPNPCMNSGICFYNNSTEKFECQCSDQYKGNICEIFMTPWWVYLVIGLSILLIILIIIFLCIFCMRRGKNKNTPDINKIHENVVTYNQSAGEEDYHGRPIDLDVLKYRPGNIEKFSMLMKRKKEVEEENNYFIFDHPLEYGYEGINNDRESLSSIGSKSTDDLLNIHPLRTNNDQFLNLKMLYE